MKKLLAILALVTLPVFGETLATAVNRDGGMLVLTDVKCKNKNSFIAYTFASNGSTTLGCWISDDSFVMIQWSDGDIRTYPIGIWQVKKSGNTF